MEENQKLKHSKSLSLSIGIDIPDLSIDLSKLSSEAINDKIPQPVQKPKKQTQLEIF